MYQEMQKRVDDRTRSSPLWRTPLVAVLCWILWTSAALPANGHLEFSRVGYSTRLFFNDGDYGKWSDGESFTEAQLSTRSGFLRFDLNLKYSSPHGDLHWGKYYETTDANGSSDDIPGDGSFSGRINFQQQYFQTSLRMAPRRDWAAVQVKWRATEFDDDVSLKVSLKPTGFFTWSVARSLSHPIPYETELYYDYTNTGGELAREGGTIRWQAPSWSTSMYIGVRWPHRFAFSSTLKEATFRPGKPDLADNDASGYIGTLDGTWKSGRLAGSYLIGRGKSVTLSYQQLDANTQCQGYTDGRLFAHFGVATINLEYWSLAISSRQWQCHLNVGKADGELDGVLEAWPFLGGLARFLGERRHFMCRGDVSFEHAAVRTPQLRLFGIPVSPRVDFAHVTPELKYVSWRPVMFGFGVDDLKSEQFEITDANLLRLCIKPSIKWNSLVLEAEISQWVPISVSRLDDSGTSSESSSEIDQTDTSGADSGATWGGFSANIRLTSQF